MKNLLIACKSTSACTVYEVDAGGCTRLTWQPPTQRRWALNLCTQRKRRRDREEVKPLPHCTMAKHHPDLIMCRKQPGVGKTSVELCVERYIYCFLLSFQPLAVYVKSVSPLKNDYTSGELLRLFVRCHR